MAAFRGRKPRRRKGPLPFRYVILLTLVIFIILTASSFWIVNNEIKPTLMRIATLEASSVATTIIQEAVKDEIIDADEAENLIITEKDKDGNISMITYNTGTVRKSLRHVTDNITSKLEEIEKANFHSKGKNDQEMELDDGIVYSIPLGQVTQNAILSTLGPDIPISFYLIGDVHTDIKRDVTQYGINNAIHEVSILVEVTVQVVIPFATEKITIENTVPVIDITERGDVPQYYNNNGDANPAIELPSE
ncbi:sporulation protein YunB [Metabacillus malikii]|uniref:Sporulation protein YunB n=1 Tax=Metabacillus malikii TaxID=1504265 RepID=A0ABT9ZEM0_9BACI|nr:sporulation protein YunB [Metabacillus malikii]MDQ0229715.1 sporulation protein YunB [Metabacillus malikii]